MSVGIRVINTKTKKTKQKRTFLSIVKRSENLAEKKIRDVRFSFFFFFKAEYRRMCRRRRTAFNWFVDSEKISLGYITYNNTRTEFFFSSDIVSQTICEKKSERDELIWTREGTRDIFISEGKTARNYTRVEFSAHVVFFFFLYYIFWRNIFTCTV